jgi:hypothetical protein
MTTGVNPFPFKSKEWHEHNAREVAARPTTHKGPRKPITPEEFENYRINGMPKTKEK